MFLFLPQRLICILLIYSCILAQPPPVHNSITNTNSLRAFIHVTFQGFHFTQGFNFYPPPRSSSIYPSFAPMQKKIEIAKNSPIFFRSAQSFQTRANGYFLQGSTSMDRPLRSHSGVGPPTSGEWGSPSAPTLPKNFSRPTTLVCPAGGNRDRCVWEVRACSSDSKREVRAHCHP